MRFRPQLTAAIVLALTGCGAQSRPAQRTTTTPSVPTTAAAPAPPAPIQLRLELPLVGLSGAPMISSATTSGRPTVRGVVTPAGATVYMRAPDGTRTVVNPRADGSFAVRADLEPGSNSFQFTAARLGSRTQSTRLGITWRALARRRAAMPWPPIPSSTWPRPARG